MYLFKTGSNVIENLENVSKQKKNSHLLARIAMII